MAVQKSKKSRSRRDQRRSHDRIGAPTLSEDQLTGDIHRRHHVAATGFYRGKDVLNFRKNETVEDDE